MTVSTKERYQLLIDGDFVQPADGETYSTADPATGEEIAAIADATATDVDRAVEAAGAATSAWTSKSAAERGRIVGRIAETIRENADELARLESLDQGKPLTQARHDVEGAARFFEYYAGAADKLEGRTVPTGDDKLAFTEREPYGVSGQIVPWNFPFNLAARDVDAGTVYVNEWFGGSPETPFGGTKKSGIGREKGLEALDSHLQTKSITVNIDA